MKADYLEKYAALMVESFNKTLEMRDSALKRQIAALESRIGLMTERQSAQWKEISALVRRVLAK